MSQVNRNGDLHRNYGHILEQNLIKSFLIIGAKSVKFWLLYIYVCIC